MTSKAQSIVTGMFFGLLLLGCTETPATRDILTEEEVERERARADAVHKESDSHAKQN